MSKLEFYRCEECEKNYKSYQGLYNHNKRHHGAGKNGDMKPLKMSQENFDEKGWIFGKFGRPAAGESVKEKKAKKLLKETEKITSKDEKELPDYLSSEHEKEETKIPQPDSLPDAVKLLNLGHLDDEDDEAPLSKATLKFQGKLARHFYMMGDKVLEVFGRGYTRDENFEIKRSKMDYDIVEETTVAMMSERQMRIPYSATMVWVFTTSIFFGKPVSKMVVKRRKLGLRLFGKLKFWRRKKNGN